MSIEAVFNQVFQPYFYYSVLFLSIAFICVKILIRFSPSLSQRAKSLLYLVPLVIPLIVMLAFLPSTTFQTTAWEVKSVTAESIIGLGKFLAPSTDGRVLITPSEITTISITGILCIVGLAAGAFFGISMILADDRVARRILRVILLSPDEHPWLQTMVADSSKKLAIPSPKVGLVEDLRPNAFTIGHGGRATVVFSIGLFNHLDKGEITAVALHELAHIKHHDFFFKTLSTALNAISFFNPVAYFSALSAQRQREMLADERAVEQLGNSTALGNALAKICQAIQNFPKESLLMRSSSSLLVTSSVLHRPGILATHPRLDKRLRSISEPKYSQRLNRRNTSLTILLSLMLITSALVASYAFVDIQSGFLTAESEDFSRLNGDQQRALSNANGGQASNLGTSQKIVIPTSDGIRYLSPQMGNLTALSSSEFDNSGIIVVVSPDSSVRFMVNATDFSLYP